MKTEKEWLENFRKNLEPMINNCNEIRKDIITWEIRWVDQRLGELIKEDKKGCGKEVCGVTVRDDYGNEDCDIHYCGDMCYHHKEVHYCDKCLETTEKAKEKEKWKKKLREY